MMMCMPGTMNNVLSDGNHTNDNNTTISSSSLSDAAATVDYQWVRHVYSTQLGTAHVKQYIFLFFVCFGMT